MYKLAEFYACHDCKTIIEVIEDSKTPFMCCDSPFEKLDANTSDGASEKHVPQIKQEGNILTVAVGEVYHPMEKEHYIGWVYVVTNDGVYRKKLEEGKEPKKDFILADHEKVVEVYAYCNLHGLWKVVC